VSLRSFIRKARRAAGLQTRTVKIRRFNSLTKLPESHEATHSLSATGHGQQKPNPSTPGPGWRNQRRRDEGGGKKSRRLDIAIRRDMRGDEAGGAQ